LEQIIPKYPVKAGISKGFSRPRERLRTKKSKIMKTGIIEELTLFGESSNQNYYTTIKTLLL
jgi:hypothetical protein